MNKNQVSIQAEADASSPYTSWVASLATNAPLARPGHSNWQLAGDGKSRAFYLCGETGSRLPLCARRSDMALMFDGILHNRRELQEELGEFLTDTDSTDADVVLASYQRWGEDVLSRLRGTYTLLIWDGLRDEFLCLRDPLGHYPLFYAAGDREMLFSTSIEMLLAQPGVSRNVNRAALADYLVDRHPRLEETCYESVKRVPAGHILKLRGEDRRSYRYWDPSPNGEVEWLTADEVEQWDEVFDRAVSRRLHNGPTGIFLSGGLDSVSVAAVATERCRIDGLPKPLALSLVFPDPKSNEEIVQRGAAAQLGLSHVVKPFFEATGPEGLLGPALSLSGSLSTPLLNTWLPAYFTLALEGRRRGCTGILTGRGGDEWLTVSPFLSADLIRDFDFRGLYRLWQSMRHSLERSSLNLARSLAWTFGAKHLVVPPVHQFVKNNAPWALKLRHRLSPWPAPWICPEWLAPDAELQQQFKIRREEEHARYKQSSGSIYFREVRATLDHAAISWEAEEQFELYQRAGVHMLNPFWDVDVVDMLYRTPPFLLIRDGRNKGLVRASVARRFPQLGFDRQRKVEATSFYASLIYRNASSIWQQSSASTLAELGVIDGGRLRPMIERLLAGRKEGRNAYRIWSILNLESWARAHVS